MDLEKIYNLCTQLQSISSTKAKQKFLIENRCDEFDEFLKWLLNPQIVTGIDRKKLKKKVDIDYVGEYINFEIILNHLKENNTGRDYDVAMCQLFITANYDYADFLTAVFTKSLKLGVDVKLVNKAYGKGFIPVHEVMLGSPRDKLRLKDNEVFFLTQKLNGVRCTYVNGKLISRQGAEFTGLNHIVDTIKIAEKTYSKNMILDGELIHKNDGTLSDNDNFRLGTGIINAKEGDKSSIKFVIFDMLSHQDFIDGKSKETYRKRREWLESLKYLMASLGNNVEVVPLLYSGTDKSKINEWLEYADTHGWEGIMLNRDATYQCKRTSDLVKIKSFKTSDLRIVDVLEGDGKYAGMLGSIVVKYKNNTVNVGSGFTDEQRKEYWKNKDKLIGRIAQIQYKEVSKNKDTGLESLQFPVIICIRGDKTEPSYE